MKNKYIIFGAIFTIILLLSTFTVTSQQNANINTKNINKFKQINNIKPLDLKGIIDFIKWIIDVIQSIIYIFNVVPAVMEMIQEVIQLINEIIDLLTPDPEI